MTYSSFQRLYHKRATGIQTFADEVIYCDEKKGYISAIWVQHMHWLFITSLGFSWTYSPYSVSLDNRWYTQLVKKKIIVLFSYP